MSLLAVVFVAFPFWAANSAHSLSGNVLSEYRTDSSTKSYAQGYCLDYVDGVADAIELNKTNGFRACIPVMTRMQIQDVVVQCLRNHPETKQRDAAGLVAQASSQAFPCW